MYSTYKDAEMRVLLEKMAAAFSALDTAAEYTRSMPDNLRERLYHTEGRLHVTQVEARTAAARECGEKLEEMKRELEELAGIVNAAVSVKE